MDNTTQGAAEDGPRADRPEDGPDMASTAVPVDTDQPSRRRRGRRASDRFDLRRAWTMAAGVGGGLLVAQVVAATVDRLRPIILLVLLSLFLSFAMEPAVQFLHRRGVRRGLGTAIVFVTVIASGSVFVAAMSNLVADQVRNLVRAGPELLDDIATQAARLPELFADPLTAFLEQEAANLPDRLAGSGALVGTAALGLTTTLVGAVFAALTVLLLTFYLVADGPQLRWQLSRRLEPHRQRELLRVWELAIAKTGGYVYSRVLLAVVSAVVHTVAFRAVDLPYALALGVWMGLVSSVVPVVGLYIAGTLPVIVALAQDGRTVITVLVVMTLYQQVENYLVVPRITEHTMKVHPAVAFLSVLSGGALLGVVGALLALPTAAIVSALFTTYAEEHEVLAHGLTTTPDSRVEYGR